jgi:hypothetical protein
MKKYLLTILNLSFIFFIWFVPAICLYNVFRTSEGAFLWLMIGWIPAMGVYEKLEKVSKEL